MRRILIVAAMVFVPMTANAAVIRENVITVWSTTICWAKETARIFTFPQQTHHAMTLHSTHYGTDLNNDLIDVHQQFAIQFNVDRIEREDNAVYGVWARKVHMQTEFYTERCIANGIVEFEINKHKEEDC